MKKALLFTIYANNNFGNKLQNYATQKILNKNGYNCDTIIIPFEKNIFQKIKSMVKTMLISYGIHFVKVTKRTKNFKKFDKLIKKIYSKDVNINDYDIIVIGSDQIWNPNDGQSNNCVKYLNNLRDKHNNLKYISISSSISSDSIPKEKEDMYKKNFLSVKNISVREDKGKQLIEKLTKRDDIEVLIDPTMMLTSDEWDEVSIKPSKLKEGKYILNYFLGEISKERKKEIERIAKENDCYIINILDKKDPFYECGPSEFLYLEKNAFLVCTDSFHSSVFAILYNTPFIIFEREQKNIKSMNSRIDTLLSKFGLENQKFQNKINDFKVDYNVAMNVLSKERKKMQQFIKNALTDGSEKR